MRYLGGYRVVLFPKYSDDAVEGDSVTENLFAQAALWNALQLLVVSEHRLSAELRLASDAGRGSISVYVLILCLEQFDRAEDMLALVLQMLPKEYLWERLDGAELGLVTDPQPPAGAEWRVARIQRRLQYTDLPSVLQPEDAAGGAPAGVKALFPLDPLEDERMRHLPEDPAEFLSDELTQYCLPLLGPMEPFPSDRRQLFEELQACAPAVISIAIHPFDDAALEEDRQVATRFRYCLGYIGSALANSGFAHVESLHRVYDRYFLNRGSICISSVRVAALNASRTVAVAHQMCAWIGGMKAFAVFEPTRGFDSIATVLVDPHLEVPPHDDAERWLKVTEAVLKRLSKERVAAPEDPRYARYLARLPHVYAIDEAADLLRLPFGRQAGLPGLETRMLPPFRPASQRYEPITREAAQYLPAPLDRIRIGRINPSSAAAAAATSDEGLHWHSIPIADLCKHALIVGSTGSGKTVTTMFLMRELLRLEIPFLVVEPVKTEYYDALRAIEGQAVQRYRFEGTPAGVPANDFLVFDPLRLQNGVTVARHVSYMKSCFEAAFPMEPWQALFLENALLEYYLNDEKAGGCGLNLALFTRGSEDTVRVADKAVYPSFATFKTFLLDYFLPKEFARPSSPAPGDRVEEFRQIFRRRFDNLAQGPLGKAFETADRYTRRDPKKYFAPFGYLLGKPTVVELDGIPDGEQKALVMAFLLSFLYERRQAADLAIRERPLGGRSTPVRSVEHVLVIEEAHRLLANPGAGRRGEMAGQDSRSKAVSLFVDMLAEIRAFRQGLVIVEQIPTKLVPEAVKNTNLKIMLRLTSADDRDYLGAAMSFNEEQKRFVNTLRAERGKHVQFVAFDENVDQPILLSLPLRAPSANGKSWLFDEYFPSEQPAEA